MGSHHELFPAKLLLWCASSRIHASVVAPPGVRQAGTRRPQGPSRVGDFGRDSGTLGRDSELGCSFNLCMAIYRSLYLVYLVIKQSSYFSIRSSVHPSFHAPTHPSIHPSIHPCMYRLIILSTCLSFHLSIYLSIYPSISLSMYLSI